SGDATSEVVFGAGNEERTEVVDLTVPAVVHVAAIKDVDAVRFQGQKALGGVVEALSIGHHGKGRDLTSEVELTVEFDSPFRLAERRPGKQGQAHLDVGGVKTGDFMLKAELMFGSNGLTPVQQVVKELFHDAP